MQRRAGIAIRQRGDRIDGAVLHGLGALATHCGAAFEQDLATTLRRRRAGLGRLLDQATRYLPPARVGLPIKAENDARRLRETTLTPSSLERAVWDLDQWSMEYSGGHYGFSFVFGMALAAAPDEAAVWLTRRAPPSAARPAFRALSRLGTLDQRRRDVGVALARSSAGAVRAFGGALLTTHVQGAMAPTVPQVWEDLRRAGVAPAEAIWLAAVPVKEAVHARFRAQHRLENARVEARMIERNPNRALGGANYAFDRLGRLREREIPEGETRLTDAEAKLDQLLDDLASVLPEEALEEPAFRDLDRIFVDTAALRDRFCQRAKPGGLRQQLHRRTVDHFRQEIGADQSPPRFDDYVLNDDIAQDALDAARAFVGFHADAPEQIGRSAAREVMHLVGAAQALVVRPFSHGRNPVAHQSALARYASSVLWVLRVLDLAPPGVEASLTRLRRIALDHTETIMHHIPDDEFSGQFVDNLALAASGHMAKDPADDRAARWVADERLAPVLRSFAAWMRKPTTPHDLHLALELFVQAAKPRLRTHAHRTGLGRAERLLDLAAAQLLDGPAQHLDALVAAWAQVRPFYEDFDQSLEDAEMVLDAAKGSLDARVKLLTSVSHGSGFLASVLKSMLIPS